MKLIRYLVLALLFAATSFMAGAWWTGHSSAAPTTHQQTVLHYACPMHPQYHSDRAGDCPSCGMRLEPVYAGSDGKPLPRGDGSSPPVGSVHVSPDRQQTIGVRLGAVERLSGTRPLRTTGRVAPNENAVYPLVAGAEGWIREVRGATTGSLVKRNEVLLSFYSSEFLVALQSYYLALDTFGQISSEQRQAFNQTRAVDGVERFASILRNLGVSEVQLQGMRAKRDLTQDIQIVSPVDGFVLERNASAGLRFSRGFQFYRIADLRQVWILADIYENQLPFVRAGSKATVTSHDQNRVFQARVSGAEPIFDEVTRTLKIRLDTDNPGFTLKPGMFVDVEFAIELPASLAVPADAIVDTGLKKTVFVDRGRGFFEPRQVETGWRLGGQVEIVKGLMAGEQIVISGTFLIDSESRMKAAAAGMLSASATDPVCGMNVDAKRAAAAHRTLDHGGTTYSFCSDECKTKFAKEPGKYIASTGTKG